MSLVLPSRAGAVAELAPTQRAAWRPWRQSAAWSHACASIGTARGCSAAAVALAWTMRSGNVIAIPESGSVAHVKENAVALSLTLTPQELQTLDGTHPPPGR